MIAAPTAGSRWRLPELVAIAVLLFGIKLVLINAFATDLPFRDQWDAEGRNLIAPYLDHGLSGIEWLVLHNVHRILTTRLFALALFCANGQWDALVECVFGAVLHVAAAVTLARFVGRQVPDGGGRSVMIVVIVVGFASPYGWENTLGGFQCQFYFLLLATLAMLVHASRERKSSIDHLCIVGLGVAAYFSLAGGVFACVSAAACVAFAGFASARGRPSTSEVACVAALLFIAAAGYAFTPTMPPTSGPEAGTTATFVQALFHCLSFPTTAGAVLLWAPCAMLLVRTIRRPRAATRLAVFDLGLALFVVLTAAGVASQRGGDVASRYKDLLWLGLFANLVALHEFAGTAGMRKSRLWLASFTGFAMVTSALLIGDGLHALDRAVDRRAHLDVAASIIASFVRTDDAASFEARPADQLPHPSAALLELVLRHPKLREVLPPSIRRGLLDAPGAVAESGFHSPGVDPATPSDPVSAATVFGTYGADARVARLVSRPLSSTGPLAIRVTGTATPGDMTATISSDGGQQAFAMRDIDAGHWTTSAISPPANPFVFSFEDRGDPRRWVAFSGPVELGRLRRLCDLLLAHGDTILAFGLSAFLVLLVGERLPVRD